MALGASLSFAAARAGVVGGLAVPDMIFARFRVAGAWFSRSPAEGLAPWSASSMVRRRRHPAPGGRGGVAMALQKCWQCQQPDAVGRQKRLPHYRKLPSGFAMLPR